MQGTLHAVHRPPLHDQPAVQPCLFGAAASLLPQDSAGEGLHHCCRRLPTCRHTIVGEFLTGCNDSGIYGWSGALRPIKGDFSNLMLPNLQRSCVW